MGLDRLLQILHGCLFHVIEKQDIEVELGQGIGDKLGVVSGVCEGSEAIVTVANNDGRAPLGLGFAAGNQIERQEKRE